MIDNNDATNSNTTLKLSSTKLKLGFGDNSRGVRTSQSTSNSRTKTIVQVEVKKKRRFSPSGAIDDKSSVKQDNIQQDIGDLTQSEHEKRLQVIQNASRYEHEKNKKEEKLEIESKERAEEKIKKELDELETLTQTAEENEQRRKLKAEKEHAQSTEQINNISIEDAQAALIKPIKLNDRIAPSSFPKDDADALEKKEEKKPSSRVGDLKKRRSGKLTVTQALSDNGEERMRSLASVRRAREKARRASDVVSAPKEKQIRDVIVPEVITVQELANRMAERAVDVTKSLMKMGMMVTANQTIDADTAEILIEEFGHKIKRVTDADVEDILKDDGTDTEDNMIPRAPVVTFMGHVDHGKTSLLDAIRKAKVAEGEAGGITQHIGAYQVEVDKDHKITFLDTPGHEAFTAMRQRGANATDIVVLVVAADDGIMAQTVEAIHHAKAADVPIIVAINKIDKPSADPTRVRTSLLEHHLVTESLGGDVLEVEVSAKTGKNLDKLLETILMQAEIQELRANPMRKAAGIVVEAKIDKNKGVVTTILVQKGTLKVGDIAIVGEASGKVRAMRNAAGHTLLSAGPSVPVEILGLDEAPEAGVEFHVIESEKQAREIKEYRQKHSRDIRASLKQKKGTLEDLFIEAKNGGKKELNLIIKSDVQGSSEAIQGSLDKIENSEVSIKILHAAVGGISTSDISLAAASNAIILAFNVRPDASAKELAANNGSDIRYYSIIYDLIDDIKSILGGMLSPHIREEFLGYAEIRDVFNMSKYGKVAGCYVTEGTVKRGAGVRLLRDNVVIHQGKLKTLKRFKDDVKEVTTNFECGMAFENYEDLKIGDVIEAFELVEEARTL
jgi:translation initiation factor IF-2